MHILRILELEGAFEVACSSSFGLVMRGSVAWREGFFLKVTGQVSSPDFRLRASSISNPTVPEGSLV